jgi:hypothetical protein
MRLQPPGGVIEAVPERRVSTEATSTSPLVTVAGRLTVRVEPNIVVVATASPDGSALSAGPEPAIVIPRIRASARSGR